jgi:MFS transporter, DHA2 family, methylenomycin A resistance protein
MMGAVLPVNLVAARIAERVGAPATIAAGAGIAALGCLSLLGLRHGRTYWEICGQPIEIGGGLGLLVPPLTSTLLGSVEKPRSGIAAGVLNSTRRTGSVLGVALFGLLLGARRDFMSGVHAALIISASAAVDCRGDDSRRRPPQRESRRIRWPNVRTFRSRRAA